MGDEPSVAKVVQQITETLSDAVAQLVVLVVALQEQNAEMPPTLPAAADAVGNASSTLVNVARSLANEDYADYPDMKNQILNAADGVEQAGASMIAAVRSVASSHDRKTGWSQLVECCKIIAGKTIILLQLVYGAEIYRLFACSDMTLDSLNRMDTKVATEDPQTFANVAGEAATRASQLAEYVKAKAADTESPILKATLTEVALMLEQDSDALINEANNFLQDPDNDSAQKAITERLERVKSHIKKVTDPLQEDLQTVQSDLDRLQNASGSDAIEALFPAPKPALGHKAPSQDLADEPVVVVAYRGGSLADMLEVSAFNGDALAVKAILKELEDNTKQLQANALIASATIEDPVQKKKLLTTVEEVSQLYPATLDLAQKTVNDPKRKEELRKHNHQLKNKYESVADTLRPGAAAAVAISEDQRKLEIVKAKAERGDVAGVEAALLDLQEANRNLQRKVEIRAVQIDDSGSRKEALEALGELERLQPMFATSAKKLAKNPQNRQAQNELTDTSERIKNALLVMESTADPIGNQEILVAAQLGQSESSKLQDAAKAGNKEAVADAAKRLQRANIKLAKQARAKAIRIEDPVKRRELLAALDEMDRLLPEQLSAASDVVNDPKDPAKQARLRAVTDAALNALATIEGSVDPSAPVISAAVRDQQKVAQLNASVARSDPKEIESSLKDVQDAHEELLRRGREEEKNRIDPHRRKELGNALNELEKLLPLQVKLVKEAKEKPKDNQAKKAVQEINDQIQEALENVSRKAILAHKDKAAEAVAQGLDELDRLLDAVRKEDPAKAALAVKSMTVANYKLADEARKQAAASEDAPKKKAIHDAVNELELLLPIQMRLAREALAHPQDKKKQTELEELTERLKDASDAVIAAMANSPDEASAATVNQQAKDALRLANAAKEGDARAVEMAAKALAKKLPKLVNQARAKAAKTDDPDLRREIMNAVETIETLIPKQIQSAKDSILNPENEEIRRRLDEANEELLAAFDDLSNAMAPSDPARAIVVAAEVESKAIAELRSAAQKGDNRAAEENLAALEDALQKLIQNAQSELIYANDPHAKKHLAEAINDLDALQLKTRPAVMAALANPRDKKAAKALNDDLDKIAAATDKVVESSKAKTLAEARKQERALEQLGNAAKKADAQAVAAAARSLARRAPKLAEQARAQARKMDDPIKKKAILAVVDDLERMLPQQVAASLAVANKPDDKKAKEALDTTMTDYTNLLNTLESAIRPIPKDKMREAAEREVTNLGRLTEHIAKGDARGLEETLRQLEEDNDVLAQTARAESAKDPSLKNMRDAVKDLEDLLATVKETARAALKEPKDKKTQADLADFCVKLERKVHDVAETMDPAYRAKRERELARAAADLDEIVPRLKDACERVNKNPKDRKALDELEEIISRSQFPLEVIARSRMPTLEEEVVEARLREKEALASLEEQCRKGNREALETELRKLNKAHDNFIECSRRRSEETKDPAKKKRILDAINDLDRLLPDTIEAARRLTNNPRDAQLRKELAEMRGLMEAALDRTEQEAVPSLEASVLEVSEVMPSETEKLIKSLEDGDEGRARSALEDMDDMVQSIVQKSKLALEKETDPKNKKELEDALANLESVASQIKPTAMATLSRPKGDRKAVHDLTLAAKHLTSALNGMRMTLRADTVAQAQVQEANLSRIVAASKKKDARELAEATKVMAAHHKRLTDQAREDAARSDPAHKKQIMDMITELDNLLPRQVNAVKESLQNPNNEEKQDNLVRVIDGSVAALANLQDSVRPSPARAADKLASRDVAQLAILQGLAKRGDRANTETALNRIRETQEAMKAQARQEMEKLDKPEEREKLTRAIQEIDTLYDRLASAAREAASAPENRTKQDELDDAIYQMKKPVDTIHDIIKVNEIVKKNNFTAATAVIASVKGKKTDPRTLLQAASDLANHLNVLTYDISVQAHKKRDEATGSAAAALDLDSLLSDLDKISGEVSHAKPAPKAEAPAPNIDSLLGDLEAMSQSSKTPAGASLEESIVQVAENLKKRTHSMVASSSGGEQMTGKHTAVIGAELSKLAVACKEGKRQQFLISARTIAGVIRALSLDVKAYGSSCSDPELKERLTRSTQALQNFSIQLKILASVKAASETQDPDADQQLAVLTRNLGQMLNSTISAVHVCYLKYHANANRARFSTQ